MYLPFVWYIFLSKYSMYSRVLYRLGLRKYECTVRGNWKPTLLIRIILLYVERMYVCNLDLVIYP